MVLGRRRRRRAVTGAGVGLVVAMGMVVSGCAGGASADVAGAAVTTVPGPTVTVTATVTSPPETITTTVTATAAPETATKTVEPAAVTVTETRTVTATGQIAGFVGGGGGSGGGGESGSGGSRGPSAPVGGWKNCSEARAAGAAPVYRGDPGYHKRLDRDGDGVGCE